MKNRFIMLARTSALSLALAALTGCPEAAESQSLGSAASDGGTAEKAKVETKPAAVEATADVNATTNAVSGDIRQQLAPAIPPMSPGLNDVVRLAQSKMGDDVLLAYIGRSGVEYNPTTEELVYLHDLGVSDKVIAEILKRAPQSVAAKNQKPSEPLNIPVVNAPMQAAATNPPVAAAPVATNPAPAVVAAAPAPVQVVQPPQQIIIQQQPIVIQQAPQEVQYFYSSLSPYGSWMEVDGYGWCWQPTIAVSVDWRPYQQGGRWIYSDAGWYWQSDYSWGWAPFHYGRWFNHPRRGWCWVPDRVWGPSWVSWRTSTSYCGWAPLPPAARYRSGFGLSYYDRNVGISFEFGLGATDYTFVGIGHFYDHNPYQHRLPHSQVTRVYNQTTVNNVIVQGNNNNVVINQGGASVTQISRAARVEVQKVAVMEAPAQRSGVQPDRLVRDNGMLAVYRPAMPGNNSTARLNSEPAKAAVATAPAARPGSNNGNSEKRNHAPALLPSSNQTTVSAPAPTAPATVLQRYEAPKAAELPVLKRPAAPVRSGSATGNPYQPAGNDRPLTAPTPVQPATPAVTTRGTAYVPPSKNAPEANRPMTPPQPIYGAPATPGVGKPVQPATAEQSRLTPPQPVQPAAPAVTRNEPTKPSVNTRPTYNNPRTYEAPATVNTPRVTTQQAPTYSAPTPTYTAPTPTYTAPTPTYTAPTPTYTAPTPTMNRPTPTYTAPTPTYNKPVQTYTAPTPTYTAPTPTYTPPVQTPRPTYTAPVTPTAPPQRTYESPRPTYTAPAVQPAPVVRPSTPQPSPAPSQGGGRGNDDNGGNKRPGSR
jgi:hypothetical protein